MKKIYISGKITGIEAEAERLFSAAEIKLREMNYDPINPFTLNHDHDKSWNSYMREDIKQLCDCDAIYLLSNWKESKGALIEYEIAVYLGLYVHYEEVVLLNKKNVLLEDLESIFKKCLETAIRKNADYAGSGKETDPFKNFKGSEFVKVSPDRAILVRIMDKISRVSNLLSQEAQVKDEAIEDTLMDLVNYAAILFSYIKHNNKPATSMLIQTHFPLDKK